MRSASHVEKVCAHRRLAFPSQAQLARAAASAPGLRQLRQRSAAPTRPAHPFGMESKGRVGAVGALRGCAERRGWGVLEWGAGAGAAAVC